MVIYRRRRLILTLDKVIEEKVAERARKLQEAAESEQRRIQCEADSVLR